MTAYTPIYNLPYVEASDLVANYPTISEELAENVETAIANSFPRNNSATVATSQTTTSGSYTDLATVGPTVTVTTGTKALVILQSWVQNGTSGEFSAVSYTVSGATTRTADTARAIVNYGTAGNSVQCAAAWIVTGLTAGSNTFTMKYATTGGSTGTFQNRTISVIDMGS